MSEDTQKLGALLVQWERQEIVRKSASKLLKDAEGELRKTTSSIIGAMDAAQVTSVSINGRRATIGAQVIAKNVDWRVLYGFIAERGAFDILHKRISTSNIKDWEATGEKVPGVTLGEIPKLSVRKI